MAWLARWYLAIPISTAEVKRLLSKCGLVMTPRRNRLSAEKEGLCLLAAYITTSKWQEAKLLKDVVMERATLLSFGDGIDVEAE